jgi:hypothetical protein
MRRTVLLDSRQLQRQPLFRAACVSSDAAEIGCRITDSATLLGRRQAAASGLGQAHANDPAIDFLVNCVNHY